MRYILRLLALGFVAIAATHALAYHLIALLPDAATRMAALLGGHEPVVTALRARLQSRSYAEVLQHAIVGDLGISVDGVPVMTALVSQAEDSLPRFVLAGVIVAVVLVFVVQIARPRRDRLAALEFICLVPPYVPAFGALACLLLAGTSIEQDRLVWIAVVLSAAVIPAAVVGAQGMRAVADAVASDYALYARSMGLDEHAVRGLLRHEIWIGLAPSLERTVLWLAVSMMFAELVLSLPGFGSAFASALRRSDVNMLVAQITFLAVLSNIAWVIASAFRARYGVRG